MEDLEQKMKEKMKKKEEKMDKKLKARESEIEQLKLQLSHASIAAPLHESLPPPLPKNPHTEVAELDEELKELLDFENEIKGGKMM